MNPAFSYLVIALLLNISVCGFGQNACHLESVVIKNNGWELKGDLMLVTNKTNQPIVLMLNKANGDRKVYKALATRLAEKGISSLRMDLRGHGESINRGKFIPFDSINNSTLGMDSSYMDIIAVHNYLLTLKQIDKTRIGIVGASYSGEEMMIASRKFRMAKSYIALSPGSFSDESIVSVDSCLTPMLFIKSNDERSMQGFEADLFLKSKKAKLMIVAGKFHATDILEAFPEMNALLAAWLKSNL